MAEEVQNTDQKSSYRSIFKATSLFGGVQAYQILIELIKSKFIAVLLGPTGVGISGLYTSATSLIQQLTSFGLSSSAVRNVSEANGTGDRSRISRVVTALRKLVWATGFLGMLAVIGFSPILSKTSFGDNAHIIPFILISVTLLFSQISVGQRVVLQGTRRLKYLAKSSAIGVTLGLIVCIPLYYFWGVKGIVPNIIIGSVTSLLLTWYFSRKVPIDKISLTSKEVLTEGKTMLTLGLAMSITSVLASASAYALRAFIRYTDGIGAVGLFTLGFTLMNQYTGLVFSAMSTDFYPRLSAVNQDNIMCRDVVNKQNEIGIIILSPMLCMCIIFVPIVIQLLASERFLPVSDYIVWAAWGILFKVASWSIGYILLAKAESKIFMITEIVTSVYTFVLSIIGYKFLGLTGLGVATALSLLVYLIMIYIIAHNKYTFSFGRDFIFIFMKQAFLVSACVVCYYLFTPVMKYLFGSVCIAFSCYLSFKELNKRIDLTSFAKKIKKK